LFGAITLSLREGSDQKAAYSLVSGTLYDALKPDPEPMRVTAQAQGCQLREAVHPLCSEGCGSAAACVADETCEDYPTSQDVGDIRISGLDRNTPSAARLIPFAPTFFYQSDELSYPACSEGSAVRLSNTAFTAETRCIAPLRMDSTAPIVVRRDEPVHLSWERPSRPSLAQISILLDVSHHGGKRADIACEVADTGVFDIPANLVNALLDFGLAGYPSVIVTRKTQSNATLSQVKFIASAQVERAVDTGVQSCLRDQDCAQGTACDRATVTCK
jgi:hypothetical protein